MPRSTQAPDHISAYALIVEDGTKLAAQITPRRDRAVDDDLQAAQYELADAAFGAAGYDWYEVSNWARDPASQSRHNLAYWLGHDWWGVGPGAHSHVGGVRWWNVKHPAAYADRIACRSLPGGRARGARRSSSGAPSGCCCARASATGSRSPSSAHPARPAVAALIADGLIDGRAALAGTVVPTLRGRLLGGRRGRAPSA